MMMLSKGAMVAAGAALAALAVGGVAWAATSSAPAPAGAGSLAFVAGHRYEIDLAIPPNTLAAGSVPTSTAVQASLDAIQSGAFSVVSVGAELPANAAAGSGFTFYVVVDCLKAATVNQAALLAGSPVGTTITATDEGPTPAPGSTASSTPAGTTATSPSGAPASTTILGAAPALGSGVVQWLTQVFLGADTSVPATYWPGDTFSVTVPSGATWASSGSSPGVPTAGSAPYTFVASSGMGGMEFAWTLSGQTHTTAINFTPGRTWVQTPAWGPLETVRISITGAGYQLMEAAAQTGQWAAEITALSAMSASLTPGAAITPAQATYGLLTSGPWAASLGVTTDPTAVLAPAPTLQVWVAQSATVGASSASAYPSVGSSLPSDWPADPSGVLRAEFQCQGTTQVNPSAVPFPLTAWVRMT
jgi:hypothetical protein